VTQQRVAVDWDRCVTSCYLPAHKHDRSVGWMVVRR